MIIDVRSPQEYEAGHVEGAINLPPETFAAPDLPSQLATADPQEKIIVYCRSGVRSNVVIHILSRRGFRNLINGVNKDHVEKLVAAGA